MNITTPKFFILLIVLLQTACTGLPENIKPVEDFNLDRYLGDWYEIARLDHSFERGLTNVTANYSLNADGGVKVINQGVSEKDKKLNLAEGKAYFVSEPNIGYLKVSFFGPFYGSYVIFKLDKIDYQYAFVTSHNKKFLWLLSRTPTISNELKQDFIDTAAAMGFAVDQLIFVKQQENK